MPGRTIVPCPCLLYVLIIHCPRKDTEFTLQCILGPWLSYPTERTLIDWVLLRSRQTRVLLRLLSWALVGLPATVWCHSAPKWAVYISSCSPTFQGSMFVTDQLNQEQQPQLLILSLTHSLFCFPSLTTLRLIFTEVIIPWIQKVW